MSGYVRNVSNSGATEKEAKSTFDYYNYRKNLKLQEAALARKVKDLEQRKRSTVNRIKDHMTEIKHELGKIESVKNPHETSSARDGKRTALKSREGTKCSAAKDGDEAPPTSHTSHTSHVKLGRKYSLMTSRERSAINKRSFDGLKARFSGGRCPTPTVYSTLLKAENLLPYLTRRLGSTKVLDARILSRRRHGRYKRPNAGASRRPDPEGRERISAGDLSREPDTGSGRETLPKLDAFGDSVKSTDSGTPTPPTPAKRGCHVVNAVLQLPRICDLPTNRPWVTSGPNGDPEEKLDGAAARRETPQPITVDDVKCCRYIRGYEPDYMRMPADIANFIFEDEPPTE